MFRLLSLSASILIGIAIIIPLRAQAQSNEIVHDSEYYVLKAQHAEKWAAEDRSLDAKLAELRQKHGMPPNIVYILWDDTAFGDVGIPHLQKIRGFKTAQ